MLHAEDPSIVKTSFVSSIVAAVETGFNVPVAIVSPAAPAAATSPRSSPPLPPIPLDACGPSLISVARTLLRFVLRRFLEEDASAFL